MKKNIALVTGGYSGEALISRRSADTIAAHLDPDGYNVYRIDISEAGWYYEGDERIAIDRGSFTIPGGETEVHFDAVLLAMHGTPGEDGKLPGYFDMLRLPYTCCPAAVSALTFNKRHTVAVAALAGIAVPQGMQIFRGEAYDEEKIWNQLEAPLFVKPNNGGSSLGMSKVTRPEALHEALEKAFAVDDQVLIESAVAGREFTVGVYGFEQTVKVLPITEITTDNEFFDFNAKYEGASKEVTPASIPEGWTSALEAAARKIYSVFGCRGVVRIDFIYDEARGPVMLEINTIPGQSAASVIPQQLKVAGISLRSFYGSLIEDCLRQNDPLLHKQTASH